MDNGLEDRVQVFCIQLNVEYIRAESNLGYGSAHNLAIQKYQDLAKYHLVLNPDVIIHNNCLEELITLMDKDPSIALSTAKVLNTDGSIQRVHKRLPSIKILLGRRFFYKAFYKIWKSDFDNYELYDQDLNQALQIPSVSGCFMFFRTSSLKSFGGFDERYFMYLEDIDITRKATSTGKVVYWPKAEITHDWARGSHKNWKLMKMHITSVIKYFFKWGISQGPKNDIRKY